MVYSRIYRISWLDFIYFSVELMGMLIILKMVGGGGSSLPTSNSNGSSSRLVYRCKCMLFLRNKT